ncbi:MAG: sigma 54-interacting transcriptional regulator [Acidobacteria bacterium]|nr:sigma 54-interacting transcriptional regulator [Acidobacteriota bacterium]
MRASNFTSISQVASKLADTEGLRAGCSAIIEIVAHDISSRIAFVALGRGDSSVADIVAADGLGAADFRRLEARITKSTVWQIFRLGKPVAIDDVSKDTALEHLAFSCGTRFLVAVPIVLKGTTVGLIAAGFPSAVRTDENAVIRFLQVIAALIAQAMRTEEVIAEESRKLAEENVHLKQELKSKYDFGQIIGNSSQMRQIYDQVSQVSRSNVTVLLRGESGTGKELIANAIHYNSLRSKRPLVKINCSAVPPAMLEAELFGYEKGAIDGAVQRKKALSKPPTAARSSSTRSTISLSELNKNWPRSSKAKPTNVSAELKHCGQTFVSLRQQQKISKPLPPRSTPNCSLL